MKQEEGEVVHVSSLWDLRPLDQLPSGEFIRCIHIGSRSPDEAVEAATLCIGEEKLVMDDGRVEKLKSPVWSDPIAVGRPNYVRRGVTPPTCPSA